LAGPGAKDPYDGIFGCGAASGHEALALFVTVARALLLESLAFLVAASPAHASAAGVAHAFAPGAVAAAACACGSFLLGTFALRATHDFDSGVFFLGALALLAAGTVVLALGPLALVALVLCAVRAFGSSARPSVVLGFRGLCVVAATRTFVLGFLVAAAARALVLGTLALRAVTTVAGAFVLGTFVLLSARFFELGTLVPSAVAQAC
jgi:hypothetical protein